MGSKVIRNITKVFRSASGVLFGRSTAGTGRGEELTPSQVRSLLSVYTVTQTDTAISTAVNALIGGSPGLLDTLDEIAAALGDDANFAATMTTALAGKVDSSSLSESIDDRVASLLVEGTNITLTYNDASGTLTVASTAGGLSGTGSVDNAALRADGTGGATLQSSSIIINDNLTASPNNTVNHACIEATGTTTNVSVSIKAKGSGAFSLNAPDGTTTGGNVRGANAVDLQTFRYDAANVASGSNAFLGGGLSSRASGDYSSTSGYANLATGERAFAAGSQNTSSGRSAIALGEDSIASSSYTTTFGFNAGATRYGQVAHASGSFSGARGQAQYTRFVARNTTTNSTPTTLFLNGSSTRLTVVSGTILLLDVLVSGIKSDGSAAACYKRKVAIKNVGGTTSLVGSVETIGTDIEDSAGTDVAITADNTNDALDIAVTGIAAETWRWVAVVEGLEIAYGT